MGDPHSDRPAVPEEIGVGEIGAEEVRGQVARMTASAEFARSPQIGAFLRYVVEATLDGQASRIKAYTIGVEVLRRDAKFDPQLDPIVRVEATRLRRTIERYYAGPGADDPIRIDLPRGSYVPTFSRRGAEAAAAPGLPPAAPAVPARHDLRGVAGLFLIALLAGIAAAAVVGWLYRTGPLVADKKPAAPQAAADALPPGNGMPVVFMPPFEVTGMPQPHSLPASAMHAALTDAFSHFELVNVALEAPDEHASADGATSPGPRADYRFTGAVEYADDGAARLRFRLTDVGENSIVWSRAFDPVPLADDQSAAEEKVVRELAGILVQPFGVIYAHQRGKVLSGTANDPRYRCLVEVIDSFSSFDPAQHGRGRDCLERLTVRDPAFAQGFSYLAALDLREYQYNFGRRPGDAPPLDRGLRAARRGVELSPESSRAYEVLFVILFARRDVAAAFDAANKSIALNKYDMRSLGAYGARLIAIGDIERGLATLREAGGDGTVRPPFEEFFLFLGEYLRGNTAEAAFHAGQLTGNNFELGLVARALAAARLGDRDTAALALDRLVELDPAWRDDLRGNLGKFFVAPTVIDRLAGDLVAAGLAAAH